MSEAAVPGGLSSHPFREQLIKRLQEYGGFSDPTGHEQDCTYAAGVLRWLERELERRDKFIVAQGLWQTFVETLPKTASETLSEQESKSSPNEG